MDYLSYALADVLFLFVLPVLNAVLGDPAGWLFRQLVTAFRSSYGFLLLLLIWAVSVAWFWKTVSSAGDPESLFSRMAIWAILGAPALAGFSTILWRNRHAEHLDRAVALPASGVRSPQT
ncbi:hypothetical protein [Longimicrobium terrae]|uniref:Uncharacterized protein n=1 Tax=Longimicrobium terrae TaxID=1639882 RepID=A0A841GWD0_9BACT|nr:hypothetical protein [Longimicrobium terrae]MBB4635690.1 hypothetical protein [Longimicrobium terrae]MBB6070084.1 hypothetical protein [Longimicrobium terrae]NNC32987.1 hypothetical protein [Longimicrobium terrae]